MKPSSLPWRKLALLTTFLISPSIAVAQETPADQPTDPDVVVVLGRYIPEPQQESTAVANFLSMEDLDRTGDSNAAQALTRLTGLSVVSGRYVYVRGLGDRYSSALLNGSSLPSPDPLRRQVPLDLFPSNILAGATVQKTFSPNYPGEFGGGIIDMQTLSKPDTPFLTLKLGTGGNTSSTDKRAPVYRGHESDWYGFDHTLRDVPGQLRQGIASGRRINSNNFTAAQLDAMGESLVNSPLTVVHSEHLQPDFEGEITGGNAFELGEFELGLVGVVGYDSQQRLQKARRQDVNGGIIRRDAQVETSDWDIVFNTFGSAGLSWGDNAITVNGLFVRSTTKKAQIGENAFDANRPGTPPVHSEATAYYQREIGSLQLRGEHSLSEEFKIDWRTSYAESTRDAPYERYVNYIRTPLFPLIYDAGGTQDNGTTFSDLTDQVASAGVDGSYTFWLDDARKVTISGGAEVSNTVRVYNQRAFTFDTPFPAQLAAGCETPIDNPATGCSLAARVDYLFSPDNIRADGFVLTENTTPDSSYKGRMTQKAAYLMADIDVLPLVHVNVGARYEDATEVIRTFNTMGEPPRAPATQLSNTYWLPSTTLTWNFAEDLQVRFAYSQTIARPQFRELAFSAYVDPETDRVYRGNPYLSDSEFENFDSRLEYYFGANQFATFSAFYKKIDNPIEEVISANSSGDQTSQFLNAPEAQLYGLEAEYRAKFDSPIDLPFMDGEQLIFGVNYTYTFSEVSGTTEQVVDVTQLPNLVYVPASSFQVDGTKLQGTPENIANLEFGVESDDTQLTLLVGWVDERIARRGLGGIPSVIEDPGVNIDLVFQKDFEVAGNLLSLGLSGRNLLNEDHVEYQMSAAGKTDSNTYERGRNFSVSLTAKY
jgi:TonB-dependent receptor